MNNTHSTLRCLSLVGRGGGVLILSLRLTFIQLNRCAGQKVC